MKKISLSLFLIIICNMSLASDFCSPDEIKKHVLAMKNLEKYQRHGDIDQSIRDFESAELSNRGPSYRKAQAQIDEYKETFGNYPKIVDLNYSPPQVTAYSIKNINTDGSWTVFDKNGKIFSITSPLNRFSLALPDQFKPTLQPTGKVEVIKPAATSTPKRNFKDNETIYIKNSDGTFSQGKYIYNADGKLIVRSTTRGLQSMPPENILSATEFNANPKNKNLLAQPKSRLKVTQVVELKPTAVGQKPASKADTPSDLSSSSSALETKSDVAPYPVVQKKKPFNMLSDGLTPKSFDSPIVPIEGLPGKRNEGLARSSINGEKVFIKSFEPKYKDQVTMARLLSDLDVAPDFKGTITYKGNTALVTQEVTDGIIISSLGKIDSKSKSLATPQKKAIIEQIESYGKLLADKGVQTNDIQFMFDPKTNKLYVIDVDAYSLKKGGGRASDTELGFNSLAKDLRGYFSLPPR